MSREELTAAELVRQTLVDAAIYDLVNTLNPGPPLKWDIEDIADVRVAIAEVLIAKGVCTEHEFYPYLELYDPDKPFLSHQGVDVWTCVDDDDFESSFHYTVDLSNANIDNPEPYEHTQFDVRDIPHPEDMQRAATWETVQLSHGTISDQRSTGPEAHKALMRHAIEQGWLTEKGLNVPEADDAAQT